MDGEAWWAAVHGIAKSQTRHDLAAAAAAAACLRNLFLPLMGEL